MPPCGDTRGPVLSGPRRRPCRPPCRRLRNGSGRPPQRRGVAGAQYQEHDDAQNEPGRHAVGRVLVRRRERHDERQAGDAGDAGRAHEAGQQEGEADQGHQDVVHEVLLFFAMPGEETDAGQVRDHVHRHHHDHEASADDAEGDLRRVLEAQAEAEDATEDQLDQDADPRRLEPRVQIGADARKRADPAERVGGAREDVGAGVGVGERRVDDRDQHQQPEHPDTVRARPSQGTPLADEAKPRSRGPERDVGGVGREDVERADRDRRASSTASGMLRRGFLVSSASGAAASKPEKASRAPTAPAITPEKPRSPWRWRSAW